MPQNQKPSGSVKIKSDSLVEALLPKGPKDDPGLSVLMGFIGKGRDKKTLRLYLSADLESHLDLGKEQIKHTVALPEAAAPVGGSAVWVPRDLEFRVHLLGPASILGQFADFPGLFVERHSVTELPDHTFSVVAYGKANAIVHAFSEGATVRSFVAEED